MDQLNLLTLRRRMGWTSSDLARQLGMTCAELRIIEKDGVPAENQDLMNKIEFLFRQADICSDEMRSAPMAEKTLEQTRLGQIEAPRK